MADQRELRGREPAGPQRLLEACFACVIAVAVGFHIAILTLYNGPDNAIKINAQPLLDWYVGPLLAQHWSFFAPIPVDKDVEYLIRGRDKGGQWTPWINISRITTEKIQENRASNFDLIVTGIHNAVLDAGSYNVPKLRREGQSMYTYRSVLYLARTGTSLLESLFPARSFVQIQSAIFISEFPRFTKRFESNRDSRRFFIDLGKEAAPNDVAVIRW